MLTERLLSEVFYQFCCTKPFFSSLTLGSACGELSSAWLNLVDSALSHWGGLEISLTPSLESLKPQDPFISNFCSLCACKP